MWPVINEVEFYPLLCWVPKPIILTANYISPLFQKTKEHGNSDSKQASFDILRSVLHKGNVFASYCCCSKLLPIWWLKPIEFFFFFNSSRRQESEMDFPGLKSRSQQGFIFFEDLRVPPISLPFPASRVHLHSLAYDSIPSSKPAMTSQVVLMLHHSDTNSPSCFFCL